MRCDFYGHTSHLTSHLEYHTLWVFKLRLEGLHKLGSHRAIDDAVVGRERDPHESADDHLAVMHDDLG